METRLIFWARRGATGNGWAPPLLQLSSNLFEAGVELSFFGFGQRFSFVSCRKIIMLKIQSIASYYFVLERYAYLLILLLALVSIFFLSFHHGFSHS